MQTTLKYVSFGKVARRLGVSPYTIRRWHSDGRGPARIKLRAVKLGGRWATRWRWLREFFAAMEAGADGQIQTTGQRRQEQEDVDRRLDGWVKPWKRLE